MRSALTIFMFLLSFTAFAEGNCPPGHYPIGGQGVMGCAPIGGSASPQSSGPVPTGKWETRWGAIVEDESANSRGVVGATGVAESRKSKREAISVATEQCRKGGGQKCKLRIAYFNQCVALADPPRGVAGSGASSVAYRAGSLSEAQQLALAKCKDDNGLSGQCELAYSACSMSEFKKF